MTDAPPPPPPLPGDVPQLPEVFPDGTPIPSREPDGEGEGDGRPRTVFERLVPRGSARRLGLARAIVLGPACALLGMLAPVIALLVGQRDGAKLFAITLLAAAPLGVLGAAGGLASGVGERRLPRRRRWRWLLVTLGPGLLCWLAAMQCVYAVGVGHAGVGAGLERLARFVDPTSHDAAYSLSLALGCGAGLGMALDELVQLRLSEGPTTARVGRLLFLLIVGCAIVGCGGFCVLMMIAVVVKDEGMKSNVLVQGIVALWMSALASLVTLGLVTALAGPWLLGLADRLEARWTTPSAPRP